MFIALDCNGNRVLIEHVSEDEKYFCPVCGEQLIIKAEKSLAIKTHFAHRRGTLCPDDWTHDMSEWHLEWQKRFPEQYREVVIEKDGEKHRADVFINNIVIEFQHSPISSEEIIKRNTFYISCGYRVVWVFDATDKIKNSIEETIDPMKCREDDLCWKRLKREFSVKMPPQVTIYLQYKTCISNKDFQNQLFDIMLFITRIGPKQICFYKTTYYILWWNFLKEYSGISIKEDTYSVSEIIEKSEEYFQKNKKEYEDALKRAYYGGGKRRYIRRSYRPRL